MTRIGELFAGYGGLGMGVQSVYGGEVAWVSDIDPGANKILAHRFPDVPNLGDITTVDWSQVEPVDVLCGGSPCQDLSTAGKRAGMTEGTRSNLWVAMREAIAQLRPRTIVWENVRGAYSARADSELETRPGLLDGVRRRDSEPVLRALGRVLGDLSDLGYDCRWHGLRAADIGAPHGRFRVFVVATDARGIRGPQALEHNGGGASVGDGRGVPDQRHRDALWAGSDGALLPTPRATDGTKGGPNQRGSSGDLMLPSAVALLPTPSSADGLGGHERRGGSRGDELLLNGVAKQVAGPQGVDWGQYAAAVARWAQVRSRPAPHPTMLSKKGNPQLCPEFVTWMMGLPDDWVTDVPGITRNEALKALGNGVVPQQAAAALAEMATWAVAS